MIKKYIGITLISASLAFVGCSSNDDEGDVLDPPGGEEVPGGEEEPGGDEEPGGNEEPTLIVVPQEFTPAEGVTLRLDELLAEPRFSILNQAVADANLTETLTNTTLSTLFAPTDDVLAGVELPPDQAELSDLILAHVVSGALDSNLIANSVGSSASASNGGTIAITADADGNLSAGGAPITDTDIQATNGIIHIIGGVISVGGGEEAPGGEEEQPGGEEEQPGGEGEPPVDGVDLGASLNNLNDSGFGDYVTLHNTSGQGVVFDQNPWTAFIPSNDAIDDGLLVSDTDTANAIVRNHILTENGVLTLDALSGLGTINSNGGAVLVFGGTAEAPTVNGFDITEIASPGTSALFAIDGFLQ